jgi:hypothetical protein
MKDVESLLRTKLAMKEFGQLSSISNIIDVVFAHSLCCVRSWTMIQDLSRLSVRDPEGEAIHGDFVSNGTVGKVNASHVVEAVFSLVNVLHRDCVAYYLRCLKGGDWSESS